MSAPANQADTPLLVDVAEGIATLTLNRPAQFNALSNARLGELQSALDRIGADPGVRVVVLAAAGRGFCAGHDLKVMQAARQSPDGGAAYFDDLFGRCAALMRQIRDLPRPVIAEVGGIATAAGCQLVAACDLAVAAEGTRFGVNGVNIGLFCSTPMVALSRNVPRKRAFEMLVTGDFIDATRAAELGLVNRVVPPERLREETGALARQVAGKLGPAVRIGRSRPTCANTSPIAAPARFSACSSRPRSNPTRRCTGWRICARASKPVAKR